jgi:hypothetical protein
VPSEPMLTVPAFGGALRARCTAAPAQRWRSQMSGKASLPRSTVDWTPRQRVISAREVNQGRPRCRGRRVQRAPAASGRPLSWRNPGADILYALSLAEEKLTAAIATIRRHLIVALATTLARCSCRNVPRETAGALHFHDTVSITGQSRNAACLMLGLATCGSSVKTPFRSGQAMILPVPLDKSGKSGLYRGSRLKAKIAAGCFYIRIACRHIAELHR